MKTGVKGLRARVAPPPRFLRGGGLDPANPVNPLKFPRRPAITVNGVTGGESDYPRNPAKKLEGYPVNSRGRVQWSRSEGRHD